MTGRRPWKLLAAGVLVALFLPDSPGGHFIVGAVTAPWAVYVIPRAVYGRGLDVAAFRRAWAFQAVLDAVIWLVLPPRDLASADGAALSAFAALAWDGWSWRGKRSPRELGGRALEALGRMAAGMRDAVRGPVPGTSR